MKRVAYSPILMLGRRLITTTQRSVQGVPGAILPGQAEVNEVVAWGSLCPVVAWSFSFEVLSSINFNGMEPVGVHPRRIEHDVVCRTVPKGNCFDKGPETRHSESGVPMGNILLMQELETLRQEISDQLMPLMKKSAELTSHICVKKATNSPYVRKLGLSKGRRYGITISC